MALSVFCKAVIVSWVCGLVGNIAVESAVYPFSYYDKTPYHALRDYNRTLNDISEEDCAFECRVEYSFTCRSFDYDMRTDTCYLSSNTFQSLDVSLHEDTDFNYYQRIIGECSRPAVGIGDGTIPLDDISMSSFLGDMERGPIGISKAHVRLNSAGAWCSEELVDIADFEEWVQVDMGELKYVHDIGTQGFDHEDLDDIYVTEYYVTYSNVSDSGPWNEYTENGARKVFKANVDKNTEVKNELSPPVHAQWIRVHAVGAQSHPCMRMEVYGCKDDCQPNPCWNNATCIDNRPEVWNVTCTCLDGFVGDFCEIDFNDCWSAPCDNGGTCVDHIDAYSCECAPGWTGDQCEENFDECVSDPCQNGGTCSDDINGYNCTCVDGYEGPQCQNFTVECGEGEIPGWHTCYLLVLDSNDYADQSAAKEVCEGIRGHLFYPDNYEEQLHIGEKLIEANADTSDIFYIGLTYSVVNDSEVIAFDDGSGGPALSSWQNVNGTVDYWAQAYPTGDQACMAYLYESQGWVWRNLACDEVKGYICEVDRVHGNWSEWSEWSECSVTCGPGEGVHIRTRNCSNPAPLLTGDDCVGHSNETKECGTICPIVECPDGFIRRYDTCYKLEIGATADYSSAKTACEGLQEPYGSHLVFVNDYEEEAFITEMLDDAGADLDDVIYTGQKLSMGNVTLDWQYADAVGQSIDTTSWDAVGQSPWLSGEPSGAGSCVVLSYNSTLGTWRWAASQCSSSIGYICEANIGNGSYSDWSRWGDCSVTCGPDEGQQYRTRLCDNPAPILGGGNCTEHNTESQSCGVDCPIVSCPNGFIPSYDSCYLMGNTTGTYSQAKAECAESAYQAHLVFIDDYFEQMFLDYRLRQVWDADNSVTVYTGNNYTGGEVAFDGAGGGPNVTQWGLDDRALWVSGYPDDSEATAVRVVLAYEESENVWLWANSDGSDSLGFICEQTRAPGNWGDWSGWTECSVSCGNGTQTRSRECDNPAPVLGGANCTGESMDSRVCHDPCPIVTCPDGFETRYDSCYKVLIDDTKMYGQAKTACEDLTNSTGHLVYIDNYDEQEFVHFELKSSGADASDFYFTGIKYANQNLTFDDNSGGPTLTSWPSDSPWAAGYPQNSGVACVALTYDSNVKEWLLGDHSCTSQLGYICEISQTPGNWGSWSGWSSCSATCGESAGQGTQYRNRTCSDPAPILGGDDCVGNDTEWQGCGSQCPPENGGWSEWNFTTECSVSCYSFDDSGNRFGGLRNRTRACNNPSPRYGGNDCEGDADEVVECGTEDGNACPAIDGGWSDWSNWTDCPVTCGGGLQNRTRSCDNPEPEHGGLNCAGDATESQDCATNPCPVDGGWSNWSNWTQCPVSCGGSNHTRTRDCDNPATAHGGNECVGDDTETQECNTQSCPVDGSWGGWGNWSDCPVTCGNTGEYVQVRTRDCDSPPAQHGGLECPGDGNETQTCATNSCPVNGSWAEWGEWGACSTTCDGGTEKRRRNCTDPAPAHGGEDCEGNSTESRSCGTTPCPVDGQWGEWSSWGACSVECAGEGTQSRTRQCDDPAAANGGSDCPATDDDTEYQSCGSQPCPINGGWGTWGSWGDCSIDCGTGGVRYKHRLCNNPTPQYDGDDCPGDAYEREACDSATSCRDVNVASGKKTWQSTDAYENQGFSSEAVDGDATASFASGSCTHTQAESQPWWKVDLGGTFHVDNVYVVNRDTNMARLDNMEVRVGMNWDHTKNFRCGEIVAEAAATMTVECVEPIPGRYVSIQTINSTVAMTLCEVEVYTAQLAFHAQGSGGTYSLTYSDAQAECKKYGAEVATYSDLYAAWEAGLHVCAAGWLSDATVRFPLQYAQTGCGSSAGIINWGSVDTSSKYDVYCFIRNIEDGALGMATGEITDSQLSVSQTASGGSKGASAARLYASNGTEAWCPSDPDPDDWLLIDLVDPVTLKGVATSGRSSVAKYVTSYHLLYSADGVDWFNYTDENNDTKLFQANFDETTVVRHSLGLIPDVRYVKIMPQTWVGEISLRTELYGAYQPVVGGWTEWGSWGSCTVTCEGSGVQQRTRTCSNPTPDHGAIRCQGDEFIDGLGDPLQYFAATEGHKLNGYDEITYTNVTSVEKCASLCLIETTLNCSSFEYSLESEDCVLSDESATSLSVSLTAVANTEVSFDYYELEYHSCNAHYKIAKARGQSPPDGIYDVKLSSYSGGVYCDMTRNGGGWTLLVTAAQSSGWSSSNLKQRNVQSPSITSDYSVLGYADEITATGNGSTFKYRLEANQFGLYGGIWEVPSSYSFTVEDDHSQSSVLVERFSSWTMSANTVRHVMPWIKTTGDLLLVAKLTGDTSTWGTVVCNCGSTSYDPAPWMSSEQSSPGVIWYWVREDRTPLEPTFHWDLSGKCYKEDTDYHSCQKACVSDTVYPNAGDIFGTMSQTFSLVDARPSASQRCALHFADSHYLNMGSFEKTCLSKPQMCTQGLTTSVWLKIAHADVTSTETFIYATAGASMGVSLSYRIYNSVYALRVIVRAGSSEKYIFYATTDFPDDEWFHVVVALRLSYGVDVYIDGELYTYLHTKASHSQSASATQLYIGTTNNAVTNTNSHPDAAAVSDLMLFYRFFDAKLAKLLYLNQGGSNDARRCGDDPCPIDGVWNTWGAWGTCSVACGSSGAYYRTRTCNGPYHGGSDCSGVDIDWGACSASSTCTSGDYDELGMDDGTIPDSHLSESEGNSGAYTATYGRISQTNNNYAWVPANSDTSDYFEIRFPYTATVRMVGVAGRPNYATQYVTEYTLSYSTDENGTVWYDYEENGSPKIFTGNFDASTEVRETFTTALTDVEYIRIYPYSWSTQISMRVGVYGEYQPIDGGYGAWSAWGSCTKTCGTGTQDRSRSCNNPTPQFSGSTCSGDSSESQNCNTNPCPIDGVFGSWVSTGACSIDCGNDGVEFQTRECNNPAPAYGGNNCTGDTERWYSCNAASTCSANENNALGVTDGTVPDAQLTESETGSGGDYSATWARLGDTTNTHCWSPANPDTGDWIQVQLEDPVTLKMVGTKGRPSDDYHVVEFNVSYSQNGTDWDYYTENGEVHTFHGNFDGSTLVMNSLTEVSPVSYVRFHPESWSGSICMRVEVYGIYNPIDGEWSAWSDWETCSKTCGGGTQSRSRTCDNPAPKHSGSTCPGSSSGTQDCNTQNCPIDGAWGNWYDITACSVDCGSGGVKEQARDCDNPPPQYGGNDCGTDNTTWAACSAASSCSSSDNYALGVQTGGTYTIADSAMTASEGSGSSYVGSWARIGDSNADKAWVPSNADSDDYLEIELPDTVTLKRVAVQGRQASDGTKQWVEEYYVLYSYNGSEWEYVQESGENKVFWGSFDESTIATSTFSEVTVDSVRFQPLSWYNSIAMRVELYGYYNAIHGLWTTWSAWSTCPVSCGGSTQTRTRTCTNPAPKYNGNDCPASDADEESQDCNTDPCPVGGQWTTWEAWSSLTCTVSCGTQGMKHRTRTCTNPPPEHGGADCPESDATEEFQPCDAASACGDCYEALGVEDGRIPDGDMHATSSASSKTNTAKHARFNIGTTTGEQCWLNNNTNETQGIQVTLQTPITLTMVGVQGSSQLEQWVSYYYLMYTTDGENYDLYTENNKTTLFYGNIDKTGIVKTTIDPIDNVQGVIFVPHSWEGDSSCTRVEVYGCYDPTACPGAETSIGSSTTTDSGNVIVDLQGLYKVTVVSTKGQNTNWLEGYTMYFSDNKVEWSQYREDGQERSFIGNSDASNDVSNPLMNPIVAQYIKLVPTSTHNGLSTDVTVYGCSDDREQLAAPATSGCFTPFGFADWTFNSDRITATSVLSTNVTGSYQPQYARLGNPESVSSRANGWVSAPGSEVDSIGQYLEVDFGERVTVTGVAVQGVETPLGDKYLSQFSLHYSVDGGNWKSINEMDSDNTKIFNGTTDAETMRRIELTADGDTDVRPVTLRYLRIQSEVDTTDSIGLRVEVYGCTDVFDSDCAAGYFPFETSCYSFVNDTTDAATAESNCQGDGGHLASINSAREHDFIAANVKAPDGSFLIGLNRESDFYTFAWHDGTFYGYSHWDNSQPYDDELENFGCVAVSESGAWITVDCGTDNKYICEYEQDEVTVSVCGEESVRLACMDNYNLNVTSATWGRDDTTTCPNEAMPSSSSLPCSSDSALETIQGMCDGNSSWCEFLVDDSTLGYPCGTSGIYLYSSITYECQESMLQTRICQGDFLVLDCGVDMEINIVNVMYGRTMDRSVCPYASETSDLPTNCTMESAIDVVKSYCQGMPNCKMAVETTTFQSDPCQGVSKYLDVNYTCVASVETIPDVYNYQGDCEDNWLKYNDMCFQAFPDYHQDFASAEATCLDLMGHLAGIGGEDTQTFLEELMDEHTRANTSFWIGCMKVDDDRCRWANGIGDAYTNFQLAYQSNKFEGCIVLSGEHNLAWEDEDCDTEYGYICQQECMLSFGLEDHEILNTKLEVSSTKLEPTLDTFKWLARLNTPLGAWVASARDTEQFLQVEFDHVMRVRKIATQGHPKYDFWVTAYRVDYTLNSTLNDSNLITYTEGGIEKTFIGNNDSTTVAVQYLRDFMYARFVRIVPVDWYEEIALRIEFYGCYLVDEKPYVLEVGNTTILHYMHNGTVQCRAFGIPLPTITWQKDGATYTGGVNATIVSSEEDEYHMVSEIQFHPVSDDRGWYTCTATNAYGVNSKSFYQYKGTPTHGDGIITCDGETLELDCPDREFIKMTSATYSREHNEVCLIMDDFYPSDCVYNEDMVLYRVETQCNNKQHCKLDTNEMAFEVFGKNFRNCDGFTKYLNVSYECIGYEWTNWYDVSQPSTNGNEDETVTNIHENLGFKDLCEDPQDVECRLTSSGQDWYATSDSLELPCTLSGKGHDGGIYCSESDQNGGTCDDYEARFLCPEDDIGAYETERVIGCDDEEISFGCMDDRYIVIQEATYGRAEQGLCSSHGQNYSYWVVTGEIIWGVDTTGQAVVVATTLPPVVTTAAATTPDPTTAAPTTAGQTTVLPTTDRTTLKITTPDPTTAAVLQTVLGGADNITSGSTVVLTTALNAPTTNAPTTSVPTTPPLTTDLTTLITTMRTTLAPTTFVPTTEALNITYLYDMVNCSIDPTEEVLHTLKANCDNKQFCQMHVKLSDVLYDPCFGVPKYLDVKYTCEKYGNNKALNKAVIQSNELTASDFDPSHVTDGKSSSDLYDGSCTVVSDEYEPWVVVDLGELYNVTRVTVKSAAGLEQQLNGTIVRVGSSENIMDNDICGQIIGLVKSVQHIFCSGQLEGRYVSIQAATNEGESLSTVMPTVQSSDNTSSPTRSPGPGYNFTVCEVEVYYDAEMPNLVRGCDNETLVMTCNHDYITIGDTFYGRALNSTVCPSTSASQNSQNFQDGDCTATESAIHDMVMDLCYGKHSCEIDVKNDILGGLISAGESDPCDGVYKYLEISYNCSDFIKGSRNEDFTGTACIEDDLQIGCFGNNKVIDITSAYYKVSSTTSPSRCKNENGLNTGSCSDFDATSNVQNYCNNKNSCVLSATDYFLGASTCNKVKRYLEVAYTCVDDVPSEQDIVVYACDGLDKELTLLCNDDEYIRVQDANWGRTEDGDSTLTCPSKDYDTSVTDCTSTETLEIVKRHCEWNKYCSLKVDQDFMADSDPCPNTHKYLSVTYRCEPGRPKGDLIQRSCQDHGDLQLSCPEEHNNLRIIDARLGRYEGEDICPYRSGLETFASNTDCDLTGVVNKVRDLCTNQMNCTVPNSWTYYAEQEPCIGTYKYLQVTTRCLMEPIELSPIGEYQYFVNPVPELKSHALHGHTIANLTVRNILDCANRCIRNDDCVSFNYRGTRDPTGFPCQLSEKIMIEEEQDFKYDAGFTYYELDAYK